LDCKLMIHNFHNISPKQVGVGWTRNPTRATNKGKEREK